MEFFALSHPPRKLYKSFKLLHGEWHAPGWSWGWGWVFPPWPLAACVLICWNLRFNRNVCVCLRNVFVVGFLCVFLNIFLPCSPVRGQVIKMLIAFKYVILLLKFFNAHTHRLFCDSCCCCVDKCIKRIGFYDWRRRTSRSYEYNLINVMATDNMAQRRRKTNEDKTKIRVLCVPVLCYKGFSPKDGEYDGLQCEFQNGIKASFTQNEVGKPTWGFIQWFSLIRMWFALK